MAGTKRAADDSTGPTTRSAKAPKTEKASSPASKGGKKGGKRGAKANLSHNAFKSRAMPLHINITHTPPSLADDAIPAAQVDPGFLSTLTLAPSDFSTGSYGWKGAKRFTVEVDGEDGKKEKVQVMLNVNATVMGSKDAPEDGTEASAADEEEQKVEAEAEEKAEEEEA